MNLKDRLEEQTNGWLQVGHFDLVAHFVLRHGKVYTVEPFEDDMGVPNECFSNATQLALDGGLTYCEGYFQRPGLPILIHHAWVVGDDGTAYDPTISDIEGCEYFGVEIGEDDLRDQIHKTGYYGVFVPGEMFNLEFLFAKDPQLEAMFRKEKAA